MRGFSATALFVDALAVVVAAATRGVATERAAATMRAAALGRDLPAAAANGFRALDLAAAGSFLREVLATGTPYSFPSRRGVRCSATTVRRRINRLQSNPRRLQDIHRVRRRVRFRWIWRNCASRCLPKPRPVAISDPK